MALSADRFIELGPVIQRQLHTERAVAGTWYAGQFVEWDASAGQVVPASGSAGNTAPADVIVGVVDRQQIIPSGGGNLDFFSGLVACAAVGAISSSQGVVFLASDTAVQANQGANLVVAGRFKGNCSGSVGTVWVDVGNTPSGSIQTFNNRSLFVGA